MSNKVLVKWAVILVALFASVYLLYPVYKWYSLSNEDRAKLEASGDRPKNILNLGLDLRGGSSLLLELDVTKLPDNTPAARNDAVSRAIEIIRNRIDQYGVAETPITRQGEKWISVQLPGIANPAQAEALIGKTAMLEFRIVKPQTSALDKAAAKIEDTEEPWDEDGNLIPSLAKLLPADTIVLKNKEGGFSFLEKEVKVTGADLENAQVNVGGDYGYPEVSFTFSAEGAKKFGSLTGSNIGKQLAIVLDNTVQSAPSIQSRITRDGRISGRFTMDEARRLAITLRAGALPAPVKIIEKRTIGPSLGEDSIKSGVRASLYGIVIILILMAIYYKSGGIISNIALILNLVFLLAAMAAFNATLTMPGIAGIILSLAMAIDANVLILERMREEKLRGRSLYEMIDLGYTKAWSAIFDSNFTSWIVALFLFQFGSGPVKGFAVTLTLGLLIGVFTSVFVTRAIYDLLLTANPKDISL
ncbi:Protein-export membrane protein SecD [Elusimicrobium minutum Pei191]|uniref:Protein translocase subunit SecD n=1 Tax=Elusimicrobium minutum (strain Pei191) TaxID=445932 RepID=SECD_ELUMP|nr:protein translocase subunit SecD [Elusimicrobium minutum]B2KBZ1.1 RecName: Full=Protein translocase subunit SecD [Elusimicrobium minutum Pei191]ACC98118.1 Protein-export membrane protein SecD [Elusimicrobium minutum Pei191]